MTVMVSSHAWVCYQAIHKMSSMLNGIQLKTGFTAQAMTTPSNVGTMKKGLKTGSVFTQCKATFLQSGNWLSVLMVVNL